MARFVAAVLLAASCACVQRTFGRCAIARPKRSTSFVWKAAVTRTPPASPCLCSTWSEVQTVEVGWDRRRAFSVVSGLVLVWIRMHVVGKSAGRRLDQRLLKAEHGGWVLLLSQRRGQPSVVHGNAVLPAPCKRVYPRGGFMRTYCCR